jgi:hypothetical protein
MSPHLSDEVWRRARAACEYCQMRQEFDVVAFQIDHIIAQKHGGPTTTENLALSCFPCNSHKGPNIAGLDPVSGELVRLFHPRQDRWAEHFTWDGPFLVGLTPVGRTTVQVLNVNDQDYVAVRRALLREGVFP